MCMYIKLFIPLPGRGKCAFIRIYIYASINGPASTINAAGLVIYMKTKVLK